MKTEKWKQAIENNRFHHLAAKQSRPPVQFWTVDDEFCARIPLTKGKWAIVSGTSYEKVKDDNWFFDGKYASRKTSQVDGEDSHRSKKS